MSSRNRYLDETQRAAAPSLYAALSAVRAALENGAAKAEALAAGRAALSPLAKLDYLDVVDGASFMPIDRLRPPAFVIGAARFGTTRLDRQRVGDPSDALRAGAHLSRRRRRNRGVQSGRTDQHARSARRERQRRDDRRSGAFRRAVDVRVADRTSGLYLALGSSRTHTAHSPGARGGGRARRSGDGEPDCETRRRHRRRHPDRGAARGAHSPHSSAGDERGDVRRRGNASQSFRAARRAATKSSIRSAVFSPSASRVWGVWPPRSGCSKRSNARCGGARSLQGKRVAITAGPTREAFDPVRFVSNASTGSTGIELAREAALRGARVTLAARTDASRTSRRRRSRAGDERARAVRRRARACDRRRSRDRQRRRRRLAPGGIERFEAQKRQRRTRRRVRGQSRRVGGARRSKRREAFSSASPPRPRITKQTRARSCARSISMRSPSTTCAASAGSVSVQTSSCCSGARRGAKSSGARKKPRWRPGCSTGSRS